MKCISDPTQDDIKREEEAEMLEQIEEQIQLGELTSCEDQYSVTIEELECEQDLCSDEEFIHYKNQHAMHFIEFMEGRMSAERYKGLSAKYYKVINKHLDDYKSDQALEIMWREENAA